MASDERQLSKLTGVYVEEITLQTPPYDEPGVIKEFVGRGVSREYFLEPVSMVTGSRVQDFLESGKELIDVRGDRYRLKYNLAVRARTKRGAAAKGRSYSRFVNPFSPNVIEVESVNKLTDREIFDPRNVIGDYYNVNVVVSK